MCAGYRGLRVAHDAQLGAGLLGKPQCLVEDVRVRPVPLRAGDNNVEAG